MISKEDLENGGIFRCVKDIFLTCEEGDICYICKNKEEDKDKYPYRVKVLTGRKAGYFVCWKWCGGLKKGFEKV